jgi:hypothetical protein
MQDRSVSPRVYSHSERRQRVIFPRRTRRLHSANVTPFPGGSRRCRGAVMEWQQISVRKQRYLPRPDRPAGIRASDPGRTLGSSAQLDELQK